MSGQFLISELSNGAAAQPANQDTGELAVCGNRGPIYWIDKLSITGLAAGSILSLAMTSFVAGADVH
jgi:hypothetical protein